MRTWSLETVLVKAYATAAVAVQGVVDVFTHRPGYNSSEHPIPGCPNATDCREYGCAGDCSEALEADERFAGEDDAEEPACPRCSYCDRALGQVAAVSAVVPGMFCSLDCQHLTEYDSRLGDEVPNPNEPSLSDDELIAVRGLIQERYCPDCSISCPPAVSATAAGTGPAGVDASFPPEVPPAGFPTSVLLMQAADLLSIHAFRNEAVRNEVIPELRARAAVFVDIEQDK